jgi:hypothetical protein
MAAVPDFYNGLVKSFSEESLRASATSAPGLSAKTESGENEEGNVVCSYSRLMHASYDGQQRYNLDRLVKAYIGQTQKLGTTDIGAMLIDTLSPRMAFVRRMNTPLLNAIEMMSAGKDLVVKDMHYRITERRLGDLRASNVNPESTVTTTHKQTIYQQKDQVLAFWGDPVSVSWVSTSQADQQTAMKLMAQQVDGELQRIRNAKNNDYWNSELQASFANGNVTKVGGIISRITTNTTAVSGDIDNVTLEERARLLGTFTSPYTQKIIFAGDKQVDVIRHNEINRYDGNDSMAFLTWEREMGEQFRQYKVPYERVYQFTQGPSAPVCQDPDMDQSVMVIMTLEADVFPLEAKFKIGGVEGPFVFALADGNMRDVKFVLEAATLDDPGEETRDLLTDLDEWT